MLATFQKFHSKTVHRVIGLMSGTSVDAIDAVLCELSGEGRGNLKVRILSSHAQIFERAMRERILKASLGGGSSFELCELNFVLGEELAHAAKNAIQAAQLTTADIDLVGSHGQTFAHLPPGSGSGTGGFQRGSTLQLGCASIIAERTRLPVVSNFRPRDMAAGGHGAPLVPFADYLLFSSTTVDRATLNIGGIANITWMPSGCGPEGVIAFDTGPGNMVLDALASLISNGKMSCDKDGALAAQGDVHLDLIPLDHPYFSRFAPKTTGREDFGEHFARKLFDRARKAGISDASLMASATALTAKSIGQALRMTAGKHGGECELIVAGGGIANPVLMSMLRAELDGWTIRPSDDFGIPAKWRECVAFAILARETMLGRPSNLPAATGAHGAKVLGDITPGG